jgi:hypothetical protein
MFMRSFLLPVSEAIASRTLSGIAAAGEPSDEAK